MVEKEEIEKLRAEFRELEEQVNAYIRSRGPEFERDFKRRMEDFLIQNPGYLKKIPDYLNP